MKIFPTLSVKKLDAYTIEHEPVAEIDLMERASEALAQEICSRFSPEMPFVVFAGPGNNGGDALAVSRLMAERGYRLSVYLFNTKDSLSITFATASVLLIARRIGIDFLWAQVSTIMK